MENKVEIKHVCACHKSFWLSLDKHISETELDRKIRDKQGYVLTVNGECVALLRYNLFWDNTPFCTLLIVSEKYRGNGYGKALMSFWEREMSGFGFDWVLVSTQSDEDAQHFYRKLDYKDCGCLLAPNQPTELFLSKTI